MVCKKSGTEVLAQGSALLKEENGRPVEDLVSSGVSSACTVGAFAVVPSSGTHSPSVLAYYQSSLEFALARSWTFSGVIQECRRAAFQTSAAEEVVTLALTPLPGCLRGII